MSLATRTDVLSPRMLRIIEDLAGDWRRLGERIEGLYYIAKSKRWPVKIRAQRRKYRKG